MFSIDQSWPLGSVRRLRTVPLTALLHGLR
jgi:hypothetical protein